MSELHDDSHPLVLAVVGALLVAVVGGTIALAVGHRSNAANVPVAMPAVVRKVAPAVSPVALPADLPIDFAAGSAQLPAAARQRLVEVADAARRESTARIVVTVAAAARPAATEDLTRARAAAVRHALEANGVASERIVVESPPSGRAAPDRVGVGLR